MPVLPMFPLGSVVVPGMVLPLHVFEMRYRQLVRDCLAADGELGVVLIERGSEVGGGDVRTDVGTVVRIVQADELADGRFVIAGVGVRRLRVARWLDDDPYPRAEVDDWPDPDQDDAPAEPVREVTALLRRSAALRAELGDPAPPFDVELADDAATVSYQATALAAFGPVDAQALLCAPSVAGRLDMLRDLLGDQIGLLEARLASG